MFLYYENVYDNFIHLSFRDITILFNIKKLHRELFTDCKVNFQGHY